MELLSEAISYLWFSDGLLRAIIDVKVDIIYRVVNNAATLPKIGSWKFFAIASVRTLIIANMMAPVMKIMFANQHKINDFLPRFFKLAFFSGYLYFKF